MKKILTERRDNTLNDPYYAGLSSPSILMLCGMREVKGTVLATSSSAAKQIREWQAKHRERYVVVFHDHYFCREVEPTQADREEYAVDYQSWLIVDRHERAIWAYEVRDWLPDGHVRIPKNPHNMRRVKRALAVAGKREGRRFSLSGAISVEGEHLFIYTSYARVDRIAHRILLHDWQEGRLKGVPAMKYPAEVYHRYYVYDGNLGSESGFLHPDGSFSKAGGEGVQYLPVSHPDGGSGMYCDTNYGETPEKLSVLVV